MRSSEQINVARRASRYSFRPQVHNALNIVTRLVHLVLGDSESEKVIFNAENLWLCCLKHAIRAVITHWRAEAAAAKRSSRDAGVREMHST
jgi:hypothetical protein